VCFDIFFTYCILGKVIIAPFGGCSFYLPCRLVPSAGTCTFCLVGVHGVWTAFEVDAEGT